MRIIFYALSKAEVGTPARNVKSYVYVEKDRERKRESRATHVITVLYLHELVGI